jgi:hypothetical protein
LLRRAEGFFEGDIMSLEEPPHCAAATWDGAEDARQRRPIPLPK